MPTTTKKPETTEAVPQSQPDSSSTSTQKGRLLSRESRGKRVAYVALLTASLGVAGGAIAYGVNERGSVVSANQKLKEADQKLKEADHEIITDTQNNLKATKFPEETVKGVEMVGPTVLTHFRLGKCSVEVIIPNPTAHDPELELPLVTASSDKLNGLIIDKSNTSVVFSNGPQFNQQINAYVAANANECTVKAHHS